MEMKEGPQTGFEIVNAHSAVFVQYHIILSLSVQKGKICIYLLEVGKDTVRQHWRAKNGQFQIVGRHVSLRLYTGPHTSFPQLRVIWGYIKRLLGVPTRRRITTTEHGRRKENVSQVYFDLNKTWKLMLFAAVCYLCVMLPGKKRRLCISQDKESYSDQSGVEMRSQKVR